MPDTFVRAGQTQTLPSSYSLNSNGENRQLNIYKMIIDYDKYHEVDIRGPYIPKKVLRLGDGWVVLI